MIDRETSENEIECPRCGERVYAEVLVCPKCGLHFYGDDLDEDSAAASPGALSSGWGWLGALLVGWLVSAVIAFLVHRLASALWADPGSGLPGQALLWLAGPLGALAGASLAARLAKENGLFLGLGVGVLSLGPAYLLEAYWQDLAAEGPGALVLSSWVVMVAAGALGGWLWGRLQARVRPPWPAAPVSEQRLYLDLLASVRHDINLAERLLDYERKRTPNLGRAALIRNALDRLEHDRR